MKLKYLSGLLLLATGLFVASCDDEDDYTIATGNIITEVTTGDPSSVTAVSAVLQGTVRDLSGSSSSSYSVGVYYGTAADPTTTGTRQLGSIDESGTVTTILTGLTTGTTYYYATFVTLQSRLTTFGDVKSFVATDAAVVTMDATDITATKATINGQFSGVDGLTEETLTTGVKLARTAEGVQTGTAYPVGVVSGLLPATTYHYAAYAVVGGTEVYGETKTLTTAAQEMPYVDLGLGLNVLWASYNLGAEAETEAGAWFGYGDATGMLLSDDAADYPSADVAGTENDAAFVLDLDGNRTTESRMPTAAEIEALIANTTQTEETVDGVSGIRFTGANGNSIFLPVTGYRDGAAAVADGNGYYWGGTVDATNADYAASLSFNGSEVVAGHSQRQLGFAIRPVRDADAIRWDSSRLNWGDLEGNGRMRIELFNQYGATASAPAVDLNTLTFQRNMVVTFTLSGITGNLKEGAAGSYVAGLEFADASWDPSYWSSLTEGEYEDVVTGDGTYTVWMEVSALTEGAVVFCIDIANLWNDIVDTSLVNATIDSIELDVEGL